MAVYSTFKDSIDADLAGMQSIMKRKERFKFLLCVIYILSKYAYVVPLKDKKGVIIINSFQEILDYSKICKPSSIWADKESELCFEMNSTNNEGKSVAAERFIRTKFIST